MVSVSVNSLFALAISLHRDIRALIPEADALGFFGVDGAVFPFGGGSGEWFGIDVVKKGVGGKIDEGADAAVHLDFHAFHAAFVSDDFDFATAEAERIGGGVD